MNRNYIRSFISIFILSLVACAPSTSQIQTAIAHTQAIWTPTPTTIPTAKLLPLSELNLEDILIKPGDLPSGYSAAQILDNPTIISERKLEQVKFITQTFEKNGDMGGFVTIYLFDNAINMDHAFTVISQGMTAGTTPIPVNIGSKAVVVSGFILSFYTDVAFIECNSVVHIDFKGLNDKDAAIAYANHLDGRLKEKVCR